MVKIRLTINAIGFPVVGIIPSAEVGFRSMPPVGAGFMLEAGNGVRWCGFLLSVSFHRLMVVSDPCRLWCWFHAGGWKWCPLGSVVGMVLRRSRSRLVACVGVCHYAGGWKRCPLVWFPVVGIIPSADGGFRPMPPGGAGFMLEAGNGVRFCSVVGMVLRRSMSQRSPVSVCAIMLRAGNGVRLVRWSAWCWVGQGFRCSGCMFPNIQNRFSF